MIQVGDLSCWTRAHGAGHHDPWVPMASSVVAELLVLLATDGVVNLCVINIHEPAETAKDPLASGPLSSHDSSSVDVHGYSTFHPWVRTSYHIFSTAAFNAPQVEEG